MHRKRLAKHGTTDLVTREIDYEARFWSRVDKSDDCWLWTRGTRHEYGVFWVGNQAYQAHIYAWEITHGPVPEGKILDHRCRVGLCVRPDHLRPVTYLENGQNKSREGWGSTGVRGVTRRKEDGLYVARVGYRKKLHHAGAHRTLKEAAEAVRLKRIELHWMNEADR